MKALFLAGHTGIFSLYKKYIPFLENKGNHIWAAFDFYNSRKGLSYWGDLAGKYDSL